MLSVRDLEENASMGQSSGSRRLFLSAIGIVIAAVVLYLSATQLDLRQVLEALREVNLLWLGAAVILRLLNMTVASFRARILFAPLSPIGPFRLFKSLVVAFLVQNVVPFRASELARVGYLARFSGLPVSTCVAVVGTERVFDMVALLAIFLAVLPVAAVDLPIGTGIYTSFALLSVVLAAILLVSRHPGRVRALASAFARPFGPRVRTFVERRVGSFVEGFSALESLWTSVVVLLMSLVFWVGSTISVRLWMVATGLDLPWFAPVVVMAFLTFGLAVPTTPGHIGVYHFLVFSAVSLLGVDETRAGAFALVAHGMAILPLTVIGLLLLGRDLRGLFSRSPPSEDCSST